MGTTEPVPPGWPSLPVWLFTLLAGCWAALAVAGEPPALMLANHYRTGLPVDDYWVSEKLDGVRAYWDGQRFWTRGGEPIAAPDWFTAGFPVEPLDGELWSRRGEFDSISAAVRRQTALEEEWRQLRYMVFDLPAADGPFDQRLKRLQSLIPAGSDRYLVALEQFRFESEEALMARLEQVVAAGGEGLMLHHKRAHYRALRSDDLLKLKLHHDAEATVIGYRPGSGRNLGVVGSLLVEDESGRRFHVGSGLSDSERRNPPAIGSRITYRYRGTTAHGLPRFATYLRQRPEWPGSPERPERSGSGRVEVDSPLSPKD